MQGPSPKGLSLFQDQQRRKSQGKTAKEQAGRQEEGLISVVQTETQVSSCFRSTSRACPNSYPVSLKKTIDLYWVPTQGKPPKPIHTIATVTKLWLVARGPGANYLIKL